MENCVFSSSFNTPNVVSGFCHFGLVFFMVLWQSPDTPVMSCFHVSVLEPCALSSACLVSCSDPGTRVLSFGFVPGFRHSLCVLSCCMSVRSRVCSSRALSRLGVLFRVGAWCSDPGTHVLSFGFVSGFRHSRSMFCHLVWACGLECARIVRSLVWVFCFVLERGVRIPALVSWVSVSCRGSDTRAPCSVLLCECVVSSVLESCALSSGCFVSCWSVVFRSRHSCLEFRFRVGVQTLALHVLSSCVSVWSRVCSNRAFSRLGVLFRVGAWCSDPGTRVLSFGFVSGFRHSRSMFCLVVWVCGLECARPCALLSMQFVFYRCDCYQFTIAVTLCRVLSCPAKPCCQSSFPYGVFCLFVLEIKPITLQYWVLASSLYPNPDMWVCYYFHDDAK